MINVCFLRKNGKIVTFNIEGHSDYSDEGTDIVCSAVSAISITIANGISDILNIEARCFMNDGFLNLSLMNNNDSEILKCQVLLETMLLGLKSIEEEYGKYIKIFEEEVQ